MSQETYEWLSTNVLAGFADTRRPWWARDNEQNLYPAAVPMEDVERLLASWNPIESALYDADMSVVKTHKLIKASDNGEHLGIVGIDYAIHRYGDWLTGTIAECVGDEAQISSAGLLRNRSQAWVQIERPEISHAAAGVNFAPYVLLSTSLDSSLATMINQNVTHTICDNTMNLGRTQGVSFKHTKYSQARLGDYRSVMSRLVQGETDFKAEVDKLLNTSVDDRQFQRFIEALIVIDDDAEKPMKTRRTRIRQEITQLYKGDARVAGWMGTAWGVVQAVNTYEQHLSRLVNSTGYEMDDRNLRAMKNFERKATNKVFDDSQTVKMLQSVL